MKHSSLLMAIATMVLIACSSPAEDTSAEHQKMMTGYRVLAEVPSPNHPTASVATATDALAEVDTSKILTFRDFSTVDQKLFKEYDSFQMGQFKEYQRKDGEMFALYSAAEDSAIREIRAKDPQVYHEWLDARELKDYDRYFKIEREHPSFEPYRQISAKYRLYETSKSALYKQYDAAKDSAYKAYDRKKDFAYQAYVAHGEKM